jgi:hypothetical protein
MRPVALTRSSLTHTGKVMPLWETTVSVVLTVLRVRNCNPSPL